MSWKRWAGGCGIGCGIVILLGLVLAFGVALMGRRLVQGVHEIESTMSELSQRYGDIDDFTPEPDGSIPPERLEAFLRVRDLTSEKRQALERSITTLSQRVAQRAPEESPGFVGKFVTWVRHLGAARAGTGLVPQIFGYIDARAKALLEAEMGLGEYAYIYAIAFYSYLGHSPADGPAFVLAGGDDQEGPEARSIDVHERHREHSQSRVHDMLLGMMRRQLAALETTPGRADLASWKRALADEVAAMEAQEYRLPWRDSLPTPLRRSLEPLRSRLESSYSPLVGPVELQVVHGE